MAGRNGHLVSPVVLDASTFLGYALGDDRSGVADRVVERLLDSVAVVPWLFFYEARNGLRKSEVNGWLTAAQVDQSLADLADLAVRHVAPSDDAKIMVLARDHRLKFNDACYLDVALRLGGRLASFDNSLRRAAREAGVALLDGDADA